MLRKGFAKPETICYHLSVLFLQANQECVPVERVSTAVAHPYYSGGKPV
jgi:hypothetical protein